MEVICQRVPHLDQYYFQYGDFKAVLRCLTGQDIIDFSEKEINPTTIWGAVIIYNSLLIKQSEDIQDLDLEDYEKVMAAIYKKLLQKTYLKSENLLEVIYIISGRTFSQDWKKWLTHPIEELLFLLDITRRLEKTL